MAIVDVIGAILLLFRHLVLDNAYDGDEDGPAYTAARC